MTHAPNTFFLKYHNHNRRIRAGIRVDNTCLEQFLHYFLNFILLGNRMTIRADIGRKTAVNKGTIWNDHEHHEKVEVPEEWKKTWCLEIIAWRSGCTEGVSTA
jgi:hypothetical protein